MPQRIWSLRISALSILLLIGFTFTAGAAFNDSKAVPSAQVHDNKAICFGCNLRSYYILFLNEKTTLSPYAIKIIAMAASYGKSRNDGINISGFSNPSYNQNYNRELSLKLVNLVRHQLVLDGAPTTKMVREIFGAKDFIFPKSIQAAHDLHGYVVITVS